MRMCVRDKHASLLCQKHTLREQKDIRLLRPGPIVLKLFYDRNLQMLGIN